MNSCAYYTCVGGITPQIGSIISDTAATTTVTFGSDNGGPGVGDFDIAVYSDSGYTDDFFIGGMMAFKAAN
jgi:hypothetical protein